MAVLNQKTVAIALVVLLVGAAAAVLWLRSRTPAQTQVRVDSIDIQRVLGDSIWQRRAANVWRYAAQSDIPVTRRARFLLDVLAREIASPTNAPVIAGSWPPLTRFLRIHYLHALETLGPEAQSAVRDALKGPRGEVREWYTLALGATLSSGAAPSLRELLAQSRDPGVRKTAARYLGWLKDAEAVPALKTALGDTATAVPVSDLVGRPPKRIYPVREQAALALEALGFKVARRGDTFTVQ
jgi:hypothetical protein